MSTHQRVRRQRLIRQAEGYLELVLAGESNFSLDKSLRDQLAQLCLDRLVQCESTINDRAHVLYLRGEALRTMERYSDAIEPLTAASLIDTQNIHIYLSLGWCYKRTAKVDLAIDALERGLEIDFALPILHYNLACYWALLNRPKITASYLSTAFEIDGGFRDLVAAESDFDLVRKHPNFLAITSVNV